MEFKIEIIEPEPEPVAAPEPKPKTRPTLESSMRFKGVALRTPGGPSVEVYNLAYELVYIIEECLALGLIHFRVNGGRLLLALDEVVTAILAGCVTLSKPLPTIKEL